MAKKAYVGVNGISKNVKNIYVGVNGVPKKVVKGYVGVNGVPKLFWDGGVTPVISDSWDYWTSVSGVFLENTEYDVALKKVNNKIAYYGLAVMQNYNPQYPDAVYIVMSPDPDAVSIKYINGGYEESTIYPYNSTITDANNITWYVNAFRWSIQFDITAPDPWSKPCYINAWDAPYPNTTQGKADAIQDMLDKIYAVPFHENYQPSETYTLNTGDIEKTVRKLCGIYLFRNVGRYTGTDRYIAESDNIDTIISTLVGRVPANNNLVYMNVFHYSSYAYDSITLNSGNPTLTSQEVDFRHTFRGYDYCEMVSSWTYNFRTTCTINANGISYSDNYAQRSYMGIIGMDIQDNGTSSAEVEYKATNAGIDL